jgi:hypothetical protein
MLRNNVTAPKLGDCQTPRRFKTAAAMPMVGATGRSPQFPDFNRTIHPRPLMGGPGSFVGLVRPFFHRTFETKAC